MRRSALGLLARREHSAGELRTKLTRRGYTAAVVEDVLAALQRERLLSDARFVEEYVRVRVSKGYGPARIRGELRQREVAEELLEEAVDDRAGVWRDRLLELHRRRFGGAVPNDPRERARRARFLLQRGFSSEQVRDLLDGAD